MSLKMEFSVYIGFASVLLLLASCESSPVPWMSQGWLDEMPSECAGQQFCFSNASYPHKQIEYLLAEKYSVMLGNIHDDFIHRGGYDEQAQTDCKKTFKYDPIYEMVDINGQVRFVVQSQKNFMQILRIETCDNPGRLMYATDHFSQDIVETFNITCQQRTMPYTFLVLSLDGKSFEMVRSGSEVPVCCACLVEEK